MSGPAPSAIWLPWLEWRQRKLWLVGLLLLASALRFVGLNNVTPPGLEHDEVAHWLINQDILAGNHAIYFVEAYGHEALFHYLQAGFGALVGDNALALRLPAAYFGVVLVAVAYALGRRLFGWQVGLLSAAFLAVLFWPVFYSRLALRAISLPVFSGLAAYFWWRGWGAAYASPARDEPAARQAPATWALALAGVLAGLSVHTYMAARAVPIFFGLYLIYLLLFGRDELRVRRQGVGWFWLLFGLIALPLVLYLLGNPGAEARIAEVDAPLRSLLAGDPVPVLSNFGRIVLMFGLQGDPLWRQNIAGQPVFEPVLALLFYAGVAMSLWRWRDSRYAFIVLWLATSIIPSLVTIDAPSSIRIINLLPVLMLFPLVFLHRVVELSTESSRLSTKLVTGTVAVLLLGLLFWNGWQAARGLWRVWPANEEVRFVWQKGLTDAAAYLDASPDAGPVAVGGWTPETMDPPTMELSLRRDDLSLRYFDPGNSLILPATTAGGSMRVVRPSILPFSPELDALVSAGREALAPGSEFALYEFRAPVVFVSSSDVAFDLGEELRFLGYELAESGDATSVLTFWSVLSPAAGPRRMFLHAVDERGEIIAQDDRLGAPADHWQAGDLLVQQFTLPRHDGELRLGVYDPNSGVRLLAPDGRDSIVLPGVAAE